MDQLLTTPSDIARVQNEVVLKRQRQKSLEPIIQALFLALRDFTTRYNQLAKEIELANASIAPIRKLPIETLGSIFEFCALQDDDAPLYLSRVCRKWRIAATSPRIWSRIVVDLDDQYAPEKARLYLERSRNTLLDIELLRPGFSDLGWGAWYSVLSHERRWRSLEISASTYDQVNDIFDELPTFAPNLVHTTVTVEGFFFVAPGSLEFPRLEIPLDFLSYTSFRSLRLQTWALPLFTITPCPVLAQLTTLHITDTYASTFRKSDHVRPRPICGNAISVILNLCPRLETFTFDAHNSVAHHSGKCCPDSKDHYTLAALQHISLIAHHLDTFAILGRVVLPALRTAYIEPLPRHTSGLTDAFGVVFSDFLRRSKAPPLEELTVFAMAPQDLVWTLERSPRLKQLRLVYCTNPAPVITALSTPYPHKRRGKFINQPRWVCPKLSRLCFEECFHIPWRGVARLIQHRHRAYMEGAKLALMVDLVINGHDVFEDRDLDFLANFKVRQITTLIEP